MSRQLLCLTLLFLGAGVASAQEKPVKGPVAPPDPESVYSTGAFPEVVIDEHFKIYGIRKYQGVVPGRSPEEGEEAAEEATTGPLTVERVGFEQRELFSRVFVLADRSFSPWVYDNFVQAQADSSLTRRITIDLAGARIPKSNDRRPMDTSRFSTPIKSVEAAKTKEGVRITVTLKKEARYLPVQVGKILYLDIER